MRKRFYLRLALDNIRHNRQTYLPYLLTCIGTVAMFYTMSRELSRLLPGKEAPLFFDLRRILW